MVKGHLPQHLKNAVESTYERPRENSLTKVAVQKLVHRAESATVTLANVLGTFLIVHREILKCPSPRLLPYPGTLPNLRDN